ncbi:hypothetical protein HanXRQr2_Chr07g0315141 [Helianthus annuus]|uniref:Uncharacterized protein n=1 Tax=Helianthus annuus TaxID=4232 RepID=A0A9K3IP49_HELAN|nr:hypothetical protein HanXRQr2_Chr07g0315141 [Helianthus annuus]
MQQQAGLVLCFASGQICLVPLSLELYQPNRRLCKQMKMDVIMLLSTKKRILLPVLLRW